MGLVLPGGALINQNWAPWRSGCWHSATGAGCHARLTHAWGMDDLESPPFPHVPSGSCVVFAERLSEDAVCNPGSTTLKNADVGLWSGSHENPIVLEKTPIVKSPSHYVRHWDRGVMAEPQGLTCVLASDYEETRSATKVRFTTKASTKRPWAGTALEATIERSALVPIARPQGLVPFALDVDAYLIVPLVRSPQGHLELPAGVDDPRFVSMSSLHGYWLNPIVAA